MPSFTKLVLISEAEYDNLKKIQHMKSTLRNQEEVERPEVEHIPIESSGLQENIENETNVLDMKYKI